MMRTYKFRLFPNVNQTRELERTLESHRRLYNQALDGKILCWENGARWTFAEQSRWLTIQQKTNPHYAVLNSSSCRQTLRKLDRTYTEFFKRCKTGKTPGYPRFKGKDRFNSFVLRTNNGGGDGFVLVARKLRLQHIGTLRVKWHRELPSGGRIKTVTIHRDCGNWFVLFVVESPSAGTVAPAERIGIDVGLKSFVTTSDGDSLGDSRSLESTLPELRRKQRALSRCKSGSGCRKVIKARVQKLYAKVQNSRRDMHHKVSRSLVNRYGVIAAESLSILGMVKNRRLARRIMDAAWGSFLLILTYKAASAGGRVELVDPKNTSQNCSACGNLVRKSLAVRVHKCDQCGCELDRDTNAARNILGRAGPKGVNVRVAEHCPKSRFHLIAK